MTGRRLLASCAMRKIITRLALLATLTLALAGLASPATAAGGIGIPGCDNVRDGGCEIPLP